MCRTARLALPIALASLTLPASARFESTGAAARAGAQPESGPAAAKNAPPGLAVGEKAPEAGLLDREGKAVAMADLIRQGPVVVIFYRGGWCPFCTKHLSAWSAKLDELKAMGATVVAISPEKPEALAKTTEKTHVAYTLLCDPRMEAARGFKLAFDLDEKTITKYKGYGIDLGASNAVGSWTLPHPATFVIDTEGVVRYASANQDYTKRADPSDAIEVIRKMKGSK